MQVLTLEKNRGYLIAGIGAIIALFAFMFLPIISFSSPSGGQSTTLNVSNVAQYDISIWIEGLAAVTALAIAALITFRPVPFSWLKTIAPLEIQIRWGNYLLIFAGILGALTPLIIGFTLASLLSAPDGINTNLASGSWLGLLGMVAVVVGGVLAFKTMNKVPQQTPGVYTQYPPVAQPQPWATPADPYAAVPPQQQWDAAQQIPPTQMQQWNTGQPALPAQPQWNTGQQVPPMQQPQWNTGQPTLPSQQPQWNTGQPTLPSQQPQWNTGQQMPPTQQQWNQGQQPPSGPPYQ